jgi:hypothetical protein
MPRYYFNIKDGRTTLDEDGTDATDIVAARCVALETAGRMLSESNGHFWNGGPWCMWVTDQPNGSGNTLFTLEFSAKDGGGPP